jgi:predicted HTH domain antitoxin
MQVNLNIPDSVNITETEARIIFATKLFEIKKLPLGKAAHVAGLSYRDFYNVLIDSGIPVCEWTDEYIKEELENAKKLKQFRNLQ